MNVYLAQLDFAGYVLTAVGSTPEKAQKMVEDEAARVIKDPNSGCSDPRPWGDDSESLWEYMGGSVTEMIVDGEGKVTWL